MALYSVLRFEYHVKHLASRTDAKPSLVILQQVLYEVAEDCVYSVTYLLSSTLLMKQRVSNE